jgi:glycosyltransferase involved in cell wall biosynthesis
MVIDMNVVVTIDHRFSRTPDGAIWTRTSFTYNFWRRYLSAFDHVNVVARLQEAPTVENNWTRCDGDGITFIPVPYYVGIIQYLTKMQHVKKAVRNALTFKDAVIIRIHGQISSCLSPMLCQTGRPYGAEVIGDPYSVLATGHIRHPLRHLLKWWLPRRMRKQSASATAVSYVTEHSLQRLYPANPKAFSTYYSSIVLKDGSFVRQPRSSTSTNASHHLVIVCTLNDLTKGPNLLVEALGRCVSIGMDLKLTVVGGGRHKPALEAMASDLGIRDRVRFLGWLPAGKPVYDQLDQADLFVLPSYQEGVSRSALEAMARGLPCIASHVGGMPEILPDEDLVPCGDVEALGSKIIEVLKDPDRMSQMSYRNLETARKFNEQILSKRWTTFYCYVRKQTEKWLACN